MMRIVGAIAFVALASASAFAQDPITTLPNAYKVEFENQYVKVVRVHYDAGAKLPEHTHPGGTTLYVYLNDSDGIVFSHHGGSNRAVTRPPVKAGAVRIAAGPEEHHEAENTSKTPSDFLRVYFKTDDAGVRNLRQRLAPAENEWSNKQMRVTRLRVEQHDAANISGKNPSLVIAWPSGEDRWAGGGESISIENHDARTLELIRIEFLTPPR